VARGGEQIHGIEPRHERRAGVVKDGVSRGRDLVQASGARIDAAVTQLVELDAYRTARRAIHRRSAEANGHDVIETGLLVGEASEELANRKGYNGGGLLAHAPLYARSLNVGQGDNPLLN